MLKVEFLNQKKPLSPKPNSFTDYCKEIEKLFSVKEAKNMIHKFVDENGVFQTIDLLSYPEFYVNTNTKEVKIFLSEEEATFAQEAGPNINQEELKKEEKEEEIITTNSKEEEAHKEKNNIQVPEIVITREQVIARIVANQKSKIHASKIQLAKEKQKLKEKVKKAGKNKEKNPEGELNCQINKILTERLATLKIDLINESNIRVSQILSQSTIKNVENIIKDEIKENKNEINSVETHSGISCSSCGVCPIVGKRYHCVYCDDVDYCEKCEEKCGDIHDHPLYILRYKLD